jgi:hypothetical protein
MTVSGGTTTASDSGDVNVPVSAGSLQNVTWSAPTASADTPITVVADLVGFASPPSGITVKIFSFVGAWPPVQLVTQLTGTVSPDGTQASAQWTPTDDGTVPGTVVAGFILDSGQFAFSPFLTVDQRALEEPHWDPPTANIGDTVNAVVQSHGYDTGTAVNLRIYLWDKGAQSNLVTTLNGTTDASGLVTCPWTIPNQLDTTDQDDVSRRREQDPNWGQGPDVADTPQKIQKYLRGLFQKQLIDKDPGPADGHIGDKTLAAVQSFKTNNNMTPVNGAITDDFRAQLALQYHQNVEDAEAADPSDTAGIPAFFVVADAPGHTHEGEVLRITPPFAIALEIGDVATFATPLVSSNDDPGQATNEQRRAFKDRLQIAGRYYEPLTAGADPSSDASTPRFHMAAKFFAIENGLTLGDNDEPAANSDLVNALNNRLANKVIVRADGNDWTDDTLDQERFMVNATDVKIVVPGAFTFSSDSQLGDNSDESVTQFRFAKSSAFFAANPAIGKIPVFANVNMRNLAPQQQGSADDPNWSSAPAGVRIVFELISPYDDQTGDADFAILGSGQDENGVANLGVEDRQVQYIKAVTRTSDFDPTDPQRVNCPLEKGGKRGAAVQGAIFAMGDLGLGDRFPWVAEAGPTPNSVVVTTNSEGMAAVCFMPSMVAGDAYRIRAYVEAGGDPGPAPASGTDKDDPDDHFSVVGKPATTGRIRIWRGVKLSRYFQIPLGDSSDDTYFPQPPQGWGNTLTTIDVANQTVYRMKRAFLEIEVANGAASPTMLDKSTRHGAHNFAMQAMIAAPPVSRPWDLTNLFTFEDGSKYALVSVRGVQEYNDAVQQTPTDQRLLPVGNVAGDIQKFITCYLTWFMYYFTADADPGLTFFQAVVGDEPSHTFEPSWKATFYDHGMQITSSGQSVSVRGAYIFYGDQAYAGTDFFYTSDGTAGTPSSAYGVGANTAHELGHVLHLRHSWTSPDDFSTYQSTGSLPAPKPTFDGSGVMPASAQNFIDDHDYQQHHCLMSYLRGTGNYCGRCLLNLRGWNLDKIPANR